MRISRTKTSSAPGAPITGRNLPLPPPDLNAANSRNVYRLPCTGWRMEWETPSLGTGQGLVTGPALLESACA
jgi:hypothetical protein